MCQVFKFIEPEEFDNVFVANFGPMHNIAEDASGTTFAYSFYDFEKDYTSEKIKSVGFIEFFKSVRGDRTEGKKLRSKDFFVMLTGDQETVKEYKLDKTPVKK